MQRPWGRIILDKVRTSQEAKEAGTESIRRAVGAVILGGQVRRGKELRFFKCSVMSM